MVVFLSALGEEEQQRRVAPDGPAGLGAVHHGHHHVQQDQVRTVLGGRGQRLGAVLRREDLVAFACEVVFHEFQDVRFVIDDQYAVLHGVRVGFPRRR